MFAGLNLMNMGMVGALSPLFYVTGYNLTGDYIYTVPDKASSIVIKGWGGGGGQGGTTSSTAVKGGGGGGGYAQGTFSVLPGDKVQVVIGSTSLQNGVGGRPAVATLSRGGGVIGWLIAGGGGGGGGKQTVGAGISGLGGAGGGGEIGLSGITAALGTGGAGGTQFTGGAAGTTPSTDGSGTYPSNPGAFNGGAGGSFFSAAYKGGQGGGGYWGGGGGGGLAGGGGGSSFVSGATSVIMLTGESSTNGTVYALGANVNDSDYLTWTVSGINGQTPYSAYGGCDSNLGHKGAGGLGLVVLRVTSDYVPILRRVIFNCISGNQTWTVPAGITSVTGRVWGPGGYDISGQNIAGTGGYVLMGFNTTPGDTLTLMVGAAPRNRSYNHYGSGRSEILYSPIVLVGGGGGSVGEQYVSGLTTIFYPGGNAGITGLGGGAGTTLSGWGGGSGAGGAGAFPRGDNGGFHTGGSGGFLNLAGGDPKGSYNWGGNGGGGLYGGGGGGASVGSAVGGGGGGSSCTSGGYNAINTGYGANWASDPYYNGIAALPNRDGLIVLSYFG